jgi:hypothetical protein
VIVTLTTVGYGDITPKSFPGRLIAIICAFVGNSLILSLPIALLGKYTVINHLFTGLDF